MASSATVSASATKLVNASSAIFAVATFTASGRLKWEDVAVNAETWTKQSANAETWSVLDTNTETWSAVSVNSETWTKQSTNSETWTKLAA